MEGKVETDGVENGGDGVGVYKRRWGDGGEWRMGEREKRERKKRERKKE